MSNPEVENFTRNVRRATGLGPDAEGFDADVLVVGLGPGGATAALALARYGVRVHAVSMYPWVANSPRAHILNQRAAEVFRDLGVEQNVLRSATPWTAMGDSMFATSLAGEELFRLRAWGTGDERHGDYVRQSPSPMVDIPQPLLEPILVDAAGRNGVALSFNTEFISHEQDESGVNVELRDLRTQQNVTQRFRYLVAFDGAGSRVADELDLPFVGELARAGTVYAQFSADLTHYVAHRPSILHWIFNRTAGVGEIGLGLLRAVEPWTKWIAGWGFDPAVGPGDLGDEAVAARIRAFIGDPDIEVSVDRTTTWYVNEQYATSYHSGRAFCGGDAVHRHPPSNGLGANTSIQDAFNLAWKVAFAVRGHAGSALLDSYSQERVPVGQQIVTRANQSRREFAGLRDWFDRDAVDPVAAGLAQLQARTPEGAALRDRMYEALRVKHYEFNAHGVESNQRYTSNAVIADPGVEPEQWSRDPELYAQPSTRPGAKLPHAWLVGRDGMRTSTLDVVGNGKFSVVTGLAGVAWEHAAASLEHPWLRVVVVGAEGAADPYGEWWALREIDEAGALLVRPDGYIAWRHAVAVEDVVTARQLLTDALSRVLGREGVMA
ncbi:MAG: FAD-dependent monooxygenase [Ilumatobacteraceae bacterium]